MKLQTIETIELSSICNLACKYCINWQIPGVQKRNPGIMDDFVFKRSLSLIRHLVSQGTQGLINVNGNGESLLDPNIVKRVKMIKDIVGSEIVQFSTNGYGMTIDLAIELKMAGIDRIDVSPHNILLARNAVRCLKVAGVPGNINNGPILSPHNWAGQLPEAYWAPDLKPIACTPLAEGRGYISSEGEVTPCCYDYQFLGSIGTVFEDHITEREIKPFGLCKDCHQLVLPESVAMAMEKCA